jgi:hypothetical protein
MVLATFSFLAIFISGFLTTGFAAPPVLKPAQTYEEVLNGKPVTSVVNTYHVPTARVLIADYELIKKDFPQTRNFTNEQIHDWLLKQGGYLSQGQIDSGLKAGVNSPIVYDLKDKRFALRPPQYDRALVFSVEGGGLLDGKGFGANLPRSGSHANGLLESYQGVREYLYTKAVKEVFEHSNAPFNVVDAYAVIDWGFDVHEYGENAKSFRAGAIFRQAHVRDLTDEVTAQGQLSRETTEKVERILRNYGISSSSVRSLEAHEPVDVLNIQGTKDQKFIYDYGSFHVENRFEKRAFMIRDYAMEEKNLKRNPSHYIVLDPKSPLFPQADDRLKFNFSKWTGSENVREEAIRKRIIEITEKLDKGSSLAQVRKQLEALKKEFVDVPAAQWKKVANAHLHIDGCENFLKEIFPN